MTDRLPDDELASAYLDDEVTVDERATVEADAALRARVEQLRGVRAALAATVEQPAPDEVDRTVAAALAAAGPNPARPVEELRPRHAALPAWLSVAAVVLALLLAVPLLASLGGGDDTEETAAVTSDDSAGEGGEEAGVLDESAEAERDAAGSAAPPTIDGGDLGALATEDDLRAAVAPAIGATALASPAPASDEATAEQDGAAGTAGQGGEDFTALRAECQRAELGAPSYTAVARYQDVDAVVIGFPVAEGTRVLVLAVDGCRVLADLIL